MSNGTRVGALSWGSSLSGGYQEVDGRGFWSAYAGVDDRTTSLAPSVASPLLGTRVGARFEVDAQRKLVGNLRAVAVGSFVAASHDYWSRLQLLAGPDSGVSVGPEVVVQGNPNYRGTRVGLAVSGIALGAAVHASLDCGSQRLNGNTSTYGGVSIGTQI